MFNYREGLKCFQKKKPNYLKNIKKKIGWLKMNKEMRSITMLEQIQELYAQWLMEHKADVLHSKDQLIEAQENGIFIEEFTEWVSQNA